MTPDDLRAWRQRLGWSQAVAAERLGCGRRSLQQWEGGVNAIPRYIGLACAALEFGAPEARLWHPTQSESYPYNLFPTESS